MILMTELTRLYQSFTPWRNEETDLIGLCSSYHQRFMLLNNVINEQMAQYAVCNEDFNEIEQEIEQESIVLKHTTVS